MRMSPGALNNTLPLLARPSFFWPPPSTLKSKVPEGVAKSDLTSYLEPNLACIPAKYIQRVGHGARDPNLQFKCVGLRSTPSTAISHLNHLNNLVVYYFGTENNLFYMK